MLAVRDAPGDGHGRLVVHEPCIHLFLQGIVVHDLHPLVFRILSSHICLVVGFAGIVCSMYFVAGPLV